MPHRQRHPERKFRQSTNCETAEYPQSVLRPEDEQDVARKKSCSASDEQKPPWSNTPRYPEEQGKDRIELDQHGEVPPRRVQIHEVHLDIDEPQAEQAENDAIVHRFEASNKKRHEINQVRDPIHRI